MATFTGGVMIDPITTRPVPARTIRVTDHATGAEVTPTDGTLATNAFGAWPTFEVAGVDVVTLAAGTAEVTLVSVELMRAMADLETDVTAAVLGQVYTKAEVDAKVVGGTQVRDSVASSSALPTTGNIAGDVRLTEDTDRLWLWDGTAWVDGGPVAVGPPANVTTDRGVITIQTGA